jgi:hypothetical protein
MKPEKSGGRYLPQAVKLLSFSLTAEMGVDETQWTTTKAVVVNVANGSNYNDNGKFECLIEGWH